MNVLIQRYFRTMELILAILLAAMVVLVFTNVVLRYAFNSGIAASEEVSRWLFVWMTFLGSIVAIRDHGHLGTDMLVARLGRRGRKVCLMLGQLLMLWLCWLLLLGSLRQMDVNLDVHAPATGLSMAWLYGAGLVFATSAALMLIFNLGQLLLGQMSDEQMIMVTESEEQAELSKLQAALDAEKKMAAQGAMQ